MGQKRLWALLTHFFYPLRRSRARSPEGVAKVKPIAKVLGIMRRLSAVLLALPLRKDFPTRSEGRCRGAHSKSSHIKRLLHKTLCSSLKYFTFTTDQMLNCTAQKAA